MKWNHFQKWSIFITKYTSLFSAVFSFSQFTFPTLSPLPACLRALLLVLARIVMILLSLGWTLPCAGWGRLVAIVTFRSGLYLGRSLSESSQHSKWLFQRSSWCLMASHHPRLIVWELKCLKWRFSSAIVVTGKSWQAYWDTQSPLYWGSVSTSRCASPTQPPRGASKEFFPWVANMALAFSWCLLVGLFR